MKLDKEPEKNEPFDVIKRRDERRRRKGNPLKTDGSINVTRLIFRILCRASLTFKMKKRSFLVWLIKFRLTVGFKYGSHRVILEKLKMAPIVAMSDECHQ